MKKVRYDFNNRAITKSLEKENFGGKLLNSKVGQILLLGISLLMILSVYRSVKQMGQKVSLLKQAEYEVEELRLENLELSMRIENASDIENLEKEARDRLNYGQENEIAFVIDEELIDVGKQKVENILNPDTVKDDINVWNEWIEFLIEGY